MTTTGKTPDMQRQLMADHPPPVLDDTLKAHLGRQLKTFYNSLLAEPLPDRFEQLLGQIEAKEQAQTRRDDPA